MSIVLGDLFAFSISRIVCHPLSLGVVYIIEVVVVFVVVFFATAVVTVVGGVRVEGSVCSYIVCEVIERVVVGDEGIGSGALCFGGM